MENKKLSSIEFLIKELYEKMEMSGNGRVFDLISEKAIEMHKKEIIDACEEFGNLNGVDIEDYKEYYTQKFNQ